jgi:K+-transporting ATPase A subunit
VGQGIAQILVYTVVLLIVAYPLGAYMAWVYSDRFRVPRWLAASERGFLRVVGAGTSEQDWKSYA